MGKSTTPFRIPGSPSGVVPGIHHVQNVVVGERCKFLRAISWLSIAHPAAVDEEAMAGDHGFRLAT